MASSLALLAFEVASEDAVLIASVLALLAFEVASEAAVLMASDFLVSA